MSLKEQNNSKGYSKSGKSTQLLRELVIGGEQNHRLGTDSKLKKVRDQIIITF